MTEPAGRRAGTPRPRRGAGRFLGGAAPRRLRLALAFLGVALAAVALLAGLVAAFSAADFSDLSSRQRADLTSAIAVAAGAAWARGDNWTTAELSPVLDLAARTGAVVAIRDQSGQARHALAPAP